VRHRARRGGGFSLLEAMVVLVLMGMIAVMASQLFLSAAQHQQLASYQADIAADAERALAVLRADFKNVAASTTAGQPTPPSLTWSTSNYYGPSSGAGSGIALPFQPLSSSQSYNTSDNGSITTPSRSTQITFYPIAGFTGTNYTLGGMVTYTFQLSNNPPPAAKPAYSLSAPALDVQKAIANAYPAGNGYATPAVACELVRSQVGKPTTVVAKMIRYWPGAGAPQAILGSPTLPGPPPIPAFPAPTPTPVAPYFELDTRNAATPVVNVCFEMMQAVKEEGGTNWAIYTRPVLASFRLQP